MHIRAVREREKEPKRFGMSAGGARGAAIEDESMRIVEAEVPEPRRYHGREWLVLRRMIHATADFELADLVEISPAAVDAGLSALAAGRTVFTDTRMCAAGLVARRFEPLGCSVVCYVDSPEAAVAAEKAGATRSAAAVDMAAERDDPGIWVIGNAPTALIRLIGLVGKGRANPELIIGMPVGFVSSAESKQMLADLAPAPYITVRGRKGGSPAAAAAANALADMALRSRIDNY